MSTEWAPTMIEQYYQKKSSESNEAHAVWTYVEKPSSDEVLSLVKDLSADERFIHDALDHDEIPRVESDQTYTYVITRFAYETATHEIETAPILFALNHTHLVTVSAERLPGLEAILPGGEHEVDSHNPSQIMLSILLQIDAEYDRFIHDSSRRIRHLLKQMGNRQVGPDSFIHFVHIEDDMNDFISALRPTNTSLHHLLDSRVVDFEKHQALVSTVILNNEQSIQTCEDNLKSVDSIRRTYTLIHSHNLDRTIKILTMVSVFISIPTMFFSMYGMNIGLPQQKNRAAFAALMIICLATVLATYLIGRKKKIF